MQINPHLHAEPATKDFALLTNDIISSFLKNSQLVNVFFRDIGLANQRQFVRYATVCQSCMQRIIIGGRDGIEFVIMASGARHCQSEHAPGDDVDAVIEPVVAVAKTLSNRKESKPGQGRIVFGKLQLVGGQLFMDKPVVRQVGIECPDHVVAVGVGKRKPLESDCAATTRVSVPGKIQPMASPPFPVGRRFKQPVDNLGEGIGTAVRDEGFNLVP